MIICGITFTQLNQVFLDSFNERKEKDGRVESL